jgi:glycosyltransferase involved in cell wall biosynthesis
MHVAFNGYFWDQPRTGSGQYLRHLWSALGAVAPPSYRSTLLLPPGLSARDVPTSERMAVAEGAPIPLLGGRAINLDKILWEMRGVARATRSVQADLLHVPYLSAPLPVPRKVKTVVTAHDMIPWVLPGYSGHAAVRLYLRMSAACVRRADLIVADSEASRRDVIKVLRVPANKVHTVYLGMEEHPHYTPAQLAEVRARHNLPEDYAFYLGGFDRRKNVPLLLRAWRAILPRLEGPGEHMPVLAIGGAVPGPGGVFPDILGEAARLGLGGEDSSVRFLGRVSEEDKPLLMAAARLFVYPSAYEGFGLDPLEAMSVGCPVVSSSGGSLREVVGDAGLLVPPNDEGALAEAIACAWRNPDLRADLSQKGRRRAANFTWQKTAEQTLALYQKSEVRS